MGKFRNYSSQLLILLLTAFLFAFAMTPLFQTNTGDNIGIYQSVVCDGTNVNGWTLSAFIVLSVEVLINFVLLGLNVSGSKGAVKFVLSVLQILALGYYAGVLLFGVQIFQQYYEAHHIAGIFNYDYATLGYGAITEASVCGVAIIVSILDFFKKKDYSNPEQMEAK